MLSFDHYPALVLNADFRPLSYAPLSSISWEDAVKAKYEDTHEVIAEYDQVVRSPSTTWRLPSVLMVRTFVNTHRKVAFNRWSVFLAYGFRCMLCGGQFPSTDLTFEHLLPRSRGGRSTWENVVPACTPCNQRKGNRTLKESGMGLVRPVYRPTRAQLDKLAFSLLGQDFHKKIHSSWRDVLYWSVTLDP